MHINENKGRLMPLLRNIERALPLFFWILTIYGFDDPYIAGLTVVSALIHECGHLALPYLKNEKHAFPRAVLSGLRIRNSIRGYTDDLVFYASGALMNFAAAVSGVLFIPMLGDYARAFSAINIASGVSNLLPVEGYDGYGILRTVLDLRCTGAIPYRILDTVSFAITVFLTFLSLYLLYTLGEGYWIFAVFSISMVKRCQKWLTTMKM